MLFLVVPHTQALVVHRDAGPTRYTVGMAAQTISSARRVSNLSAALVPDTAERDSFT